MNKTVEDIQNDFIDVSGEIAERYGLTRVAGALKGLLLLSRQPVSLDEMAERLEVSKASISTNIRVLERFKVVRRVFNRGDRKNYYELRGEDLWEIETEVIKTVMQDELSSLASLLKKLRTDLNSAEEGDPDETKFLSRRLEEIDDYLDAARHVLGLLSREQKVTPAAIKKIQIL